MSIDIDALKQAQAQGLVVGVVPRSGPPVLRLEIDDFIQDAELANLYFLALEAFMAKDVYSDVFSYYEISGIHGQPRRPWDNISSVAYPRPKNSPGGGRAPGYCAHGSVLFPTWHRAYLAQFEQALFLRAAEIAPGLNAQAVLDRFRLPYWDPLLPRQRLAGGQTYKYGIPIIFTLPQIQVRRPADPNTWVLMDNPLYRFDFPADPKQPAISWNSFRAPNMATVNDIVKVNTIRGYDGSSNAANHSFVVETFDQSFNPSPATPRNTDTAARLWHVMFDNKDYASISNHTVLTNRLAAQEPDYNENSIEGFHDDIHGFLGKGPNTDAGYPYGHMAYPSVAGFDPSFWLHHCNIDRLLAIWQGIHSNDPEGIQWWTSLDNRDGTFVEPVGVPETPTTPLAPFRRARNGNNVTWWTSNDVRDTTKLGYDYPQVAKARQSGDLVRSLRAWANAELGWADPSSFQNQPGDQDALANFVQRQIPSSVPCFPSQILLDGTAALARGVDYISSGSQPTPSSGSIKPLSLEADEAPAEHNEVAQRVLATAIPQEPSTPSFKDRFGDLGDLVSKDHKMTQWNATFRVEKYALNGPFMIHFFVGDFNPDADAIWLHDPNRVGTSSIFANSDADLSEGSCENCAAKKADGFRYYDTVGLTPALLSYVKTGESVHGLRLRNLEPADVVPFLVRNLHWRVVNVNGDAVPRETIESLKVGVYSETVTLPATLSDIPRFAAKVMHFDVTTGRPGGLNQGETL